MRLYGHGLSSSDLELAAGLNRLLGGLALVRVGTGGWPRNEKRRNLLRLRPFHSKRAMGFEPTTSSLGSWHSTTELRPHLLLC